MLHSDCGYEHNGAYLLNAPEHVLSDNDLMRLSAANKGSRMERTADGILSIRPPVGGTISIASLNLTCQLGEWNTRTELGVVFGSIIGYHLPNGALRSPDASWVEAQHWHTVMDTLPDCFPPLCPDFAAELVPHPQERPEIEAKMREFLACGMRQGWVLDPAQKRIDIYKPGIMVQTIHSPSTLTAGDLLPGFTLDLSDIFT